MAAHTSLEFRCITPGCARYGQTTVVHLHPPAGAQGQGLLVVPDVICEQCGRRPAPVRRVVPVQRVPGG